MRYSEFPHEHYLKDGKGPGAGFVGDLERWNWRYLVKGVVPAPAYDIGLTAHFGNEQIRLMRLPPLEALVKIKIAIPELATDEIMARATEAQTRLFAPLVASREDNVITVNFGRKAA